MNRAILVVGLGNPGKEYEGTRHNVGFMSLDAFAQKNEFEPWVNKTDMKCVQSAKMIGDTRVILCKPQTFMNNSGEAVQALVHFYKLSIENIIVIHDEMDIPFGQIRLRTGGSSAGHKGIKSISHFLGSEEYGRIRIGVGPKTPTEIEAADFVLQKFTANEQSKLTKLYREVAAILSEHAYGAPFTPDTRSFL